MKVYVNWQAQEIISQEQYDQRVAALAADFMDTDSLRDDYLEDRYAALELFTMSEEGRTDVQGDFAEWCHHSAENEMIEDFEEYEF
jgi:hypothetical protein